MYEYRWSIPMRLWRGHAWILPREEETHKPKTGRRVLWFARDDDGQVVWYAYNLYAHDLAGWLEFPELVAGDLDDESWETTIMTALRKNPPTGNNGVALAMSDDHARKKWPGVWEHLTLATYPDTGEPRKTSTVTFFLGAQGLTACLSDKDNGCGCFVVSKTLLGLLDALEKAVSDPTTVWREDKIQTGTSARVKKHGA